MNGGTGGRILVVEDDASLSRTFRFCLEDAGHAVATAQTAEQALRQAEHQLFDLCFLDLGLGETSGLDLLPQLRQAAPWLRFVIVTASSSVDRALEALRAGAADYLVKPCSPEQLRIAAARHLHARRLELRLEELERAAQRPGLMAMLETQSKGMLQTLELARQVARTDAAVLMLGESGTGKGVLARAIHQWSPRAAAAFVTVNTPGLAGELFDSTLFGHVRGAFTGATQNAPGRVSQAERGTLFLDEISDVPLALQPKLLRFLQDREYERLGDAVTRRADVRLIAATNRDLAAMVAQGSFREDFLYRLDVVRLTLPPLRERGEDILPLAEAFLAEFTLAHRGTPRQFGESARQALLRHCWPGNIRELRNVVERASILGTHEVIEAAQLGLPAGDPDAANTASLEALERAHIVATLAASPTLDAAAKRLGIDSSTLYRKRKHYGI
jgi:NtrC-family two-component system response regulator AlgB